MTDITRKRGDTHAEEWQVLSATSGSAIDITGYSFLLTVNTEKDPVNTDNQAFQLTGNITNAATGLVEFVPSTTQPTSPGTYYYDLQMTDDSSRIRTIDSGTWLVTQDITK